jgi:hypothetical protein
MPRHTKRPAIATLAAITALAVPVAFASLACAPGSAPRDRQAGLVLALARFASGPGGPVPQPARLGILEQRGGAWAFRSLDDPESNVFHKAMAVELRPGEPGVLTAGGTRAILTLWRPGAPPAVVWQADFGGRFSRMRDVEVADVYGAGERDLVVATHDQGVVAVVRPDGAGGYHATELDRCPGTIVHEVEVGDLDGDSVLEVYATPSSPNRLDGTPQPGEIVRYVPAGGGPRAVLADLGDRHAKEILVADADGDGRDELYAAVEAVSGGRVEVRRFAGGGERQSGAPVATLPDALCRFLLAGDVDGDGARELVATTHRAGIWLLRRPRAAGAAWTAELVAGDSGGFEHAACLADLDGARGDELYVANDAAGRIERYSWQDGRTARSVLYTRPAGEKALTWSIAPAPPAALP